MTEHEQGEYLSGHGPYAANLEQWKKDYTNGPRTDLGRPTFTAKGDRDFIELNAKTLSKAKNNRY